MTQANSEHLAAQAVRDDIDRYVVGAVIKRDEGFLVLKRPTDDFRGGTWELPSGKVETGETLLEALHREVAEETALKITEISEYLGAFDYLSGSGKRTRQHTWLIAVAPGEVTLTEHDAYEWASTPSAYPVSDEVRRLLEAAERV